MIKETIQYIPKLYPYIFTTENKAKPAYYVIQAALEEAVPSCSNDQNTGEDQDNEQDQNS